MIWLATELFLRVWSAGCRSRYQTLIGRLRFMKKPFCALGSSTTCFFVSSTIFSFRFYDDHRYSDHIEFDKSRWKRRFCCFSSSRSSFFSNSSNVTNGPTSRNVETFGLSRLRSSTSSTMTTTLSFCFSLKSFFSSGINHNDLHRIFSFDFFIFYYVFG